MIEVFPLQALDGAFNQENREKCRAATGPLIEAVENLTAFASNPEFASIPAQISPEVCFIPCSQQDHLLNHFTFNEGAITHLFICHLYVDNCK